ncbi:hypothetical protein FB565_008069 [Actinoplanes lutulentus]|uniref:Uncharacterized protein n=1 Tax=Actinoplanes lutulentus TaxID=1287878 RepID=A0A327Z4T1_9ACTN|nr:hypothetical protein [Actinoplanes lutulentus]MBB2948286.1 hypothetical protein [Actinoplanes lutulentus]RAK31217.1 hypothetical protein B0I29_11523 [Actinoplanes lutulentus]
MDQWTSLTPPLRERLDEHLRARRLLPAIKLLRDSGEIQPLPGIYQAQDLLVARQNELAGQGLLQPPPAPPTTDQLIAKVTAISEPLAAVEACWDGDTQGWFVVLVAIVRRPGPRHPDFDEADLCVLRFGGDIRLFNGQVPPWPEAVRATEQGQAVAQRMGVPFHFASPDEPDDEAPRWWDEELRRG